MSTDAQTPPMKRKANTKAKRAPDHLVLTRPLHAKEKTDAELTTDAAIEGIAANAFLVQTWSNNPFGVLDITALVNSLDEATAAVARGEMAGAESLLMTQAVSLNAIFVNLAACGHQATLLSQFDVNLRLAFKAQAQCRATLETLAVLKNPPVFTRQANITSGPQQVNNGPVLNAAPSRAAIQESAPNKLLEAPFDGERVDERTKEAEGKSDTALATVGALDGAADARGKGARVPQRIPRRRAGEVSRAR